MIPYYAPFLRSVLPPENGILVQFRTKSNNSKIETKEIRTAQELH